MNQLGLSLSEQFVHLAWSDNTGAIKTERLEYPFPFAFESLFKTEHIELIAAVLKIKIEDIQAAGSAIAVALPMNYVHVKKVALPAGASEALLHTQVEWELKNYLSDDISTYKIVNSQIMFEQGNYNETIFLAFKKSIIARLSEMARLSGLNLVNIVPSGFLLADVLAGAEAGSRVAVLRIENKLISTQLFVGGKYYYSYLDTISQNGRQAEEAALETAKTRVAELDSLLTQLPLPAGEKLAYRIYGDNLSESLETMFNEHFSFPVQKLVSAGAPQVADCGLEAIQILLD